MFTANLGMEKGVDCLVATLVISVFAVSAGQAFRPDRTNSPIRSIAVAGRSGSSRVLLSLEAVLDERIGKTVGGIRKMQDVAKA